MAPMRLVKEAGRLFNQGQKLLKPVSPASPATKFGSGVYTETPSGILVPEHLNLKIKSSGFVGGWIDRGVDYLELNVLGRIERLVWVQLRLAFAGIAIMGSAAGVKLTGTELWAPVPFAKYLSSSNGDSQPATQVAVVEPSLTSADTSFPVEPSLNYQQVKAIALDINGKLLNQFHSGINEAAKHRLVQSFSRDILAQQRKLLANTALTKEQKEEVQAALTYTLVLEFKKLSIKAMHQEEQRPSTAATEGLKLE